MRTHALVLATSISFSFGCRSGESGPAPAQVEGGAPAAAPTPTPAAAPAPAPADADAPAPEHEAKLADLADLCTALNRDYGDGTLGDYYAKVEPRTEWGKQQVAAGNETIQPGRMLEKAIQQLAPQSPPEPCRKLLDYLDEVE
jgi:hypothetical protein